MSPHRPPRVATWLLGAALTATDRDAVLGDLVEEHGMRVRHSSAVDAGHWYWGQVCRTIPLVVWRRAIRDGWLWTLGAAASAYVAAGFIENVGLALVARLSDGQTPSQPIAIMVGLAALAVAGYLASWMRRGSANVLASLIIIAVFVLSLVFPGRASFWYGVSFLLLGPLAAYAGGRLAERHRKGARMICRGLGVLILSGLVTSCASPAQPPTTSDAALLDELVTLERSALDRWVTMDPDGYLGLYADEITYFDPTTETRINGREAMRARLEPVRTAKLPFTEPRYELIEPKVQGGSDLAVLTYNMVNYAKLSGRGESILARWNATEVYRRVDGRWRIVHSHWSNVQPPPAAPPAQDRP